MVSDFTTGCLTKSVYKRFLLLLIGGRTSPIVCFGDNRKFLEEMTHNIIRGEYVS